jgi:hypothetical protein
MESFKIRVMFCFGVKLQAVTGYLFMNLYNNTVAYKLRGFSPRANHTDRAAAAGRRS